MLNLIIFKPVIVAYKYSHNIHLFKIKHPAVLCINTATTQMSFFVEISCCTHVKVGSSRIMDNASAVLEGEVNVWCCAG